MEVTPVSIERAQVANSFAPILRAACHHGDRSSIGRALVLPPQRIDDMCNGTRPNPFDQAAVCVEQLRRNSNSDSEQPFLALSRRLDYTVFRNTSAADDVQFAKVVREFADVMDARAESERPDSDGGSQLTESERQRLASQALELAEAATAFAHDLLRRIR